MQIEEKSIPVILSGGKAIEKVVSVMWENLFHTQLLYSGTLFRCCYFTSVKID
jgi:hypothetical protein